MTKVFYMGPEGKTRVTPGAELIVFGQDDRAIGTVIDVPDGIKFTDANGHTIEYFVTKGMPVIRKTIGDTEFIVET